MDNVIKQLKANEKAFCKMAPELQAKAREIGEDEFQRLGAANGEWLALGNTVVFSPGYTYRLRPDYAEKPEIVECEIYEDGGKLYFERPDGNVSEYACDAPRYKNFGGFKFEGYSDLFNELIMYEWNGKLYREVQLDWVISGKAKVLHATHVLFRSPK